MPNRNVVFPEAEVRRWGHHGGGPTDEQLVRFFTLSPADLGRADRARSGSSRLGYVVQLETVRFLGAFLADLAETPEVVLWHLAAQVDADPASWADYVASRARLVHQGAIRRDYGYAVFGAGERHVAFLRPTARPAAPA